MAFTFTLAAESSETEARAGLIETERGRVHTPAFMPVGTQATVKAMTVDDLEIVGTELLVCNTYHLMVRPGEEIISD